jgi:hypothetical protein
VVLYDESRVVAALIQIGKQRKFCSLAGDLYRRFLLLQSFLDCHKTLNQILEDVDRKAQPICARLNKGAGDTKRVRSLPFTISRDEYLQTQKFYRVFFMSQPFIIVNRILYCQESDFPPSVMMQAPKERVESYIEATRGETKHFPVKITP